VQFPPVSYRPRSYLHQPKVSGLGTGDGAPFARCSFFLTLYSKTVLCCPSVCRPSQSNVSSLLSDLRLCARAAVSPSLTEALFGGPTFSYTPFVKVVSPIPVFDLPVFFFAVLVFLQGVVSFGIQRDLISPKKRGKTYAPRLFSPGRVFPISFPLSDPPFLESEESPWLLRRRRSTFFS